MIPSFTVSLQDIRFNHAVDLIWFARSTTCANVAASLIRVPRFEAMPCCACGFPPR